MKTYSKKELEAKAQEVLEQYPDKDKVFAREDGNIFFEEHYAELDKGKLKIYPFEKEPKAVNDIDVAAETVIPTATLGKSGKSPENREQTKSKK